MAESGEVTTSELVKHLELSSGQLTPVVIAFVMAVMLKWPGGRKKAEEMPSTPVRGSIA